MWYVYLYCAYNVRMMYVLLDIYLRETSFFYYCMTVKQSRIDSASTRS